MTKKSSGFDIGLVQGTAVYNYSWPSLGDGTRGGCRVLSCSDGICYPGVACKMTSTGPRCGPCPPGFTGTTTFDSFLCNALQCFIACRRYRYRYTATFFTGINCAPLETAKGLNHNFVQRSLKHLRVFAQTSLISWTLNL